MVRPGISTGPCGSGEFAELIARLDLDPVREVAMLDAIGPDKQRVHRARDRARQRKTHDQRHELNQQEQGADDDDEEYDRLAEAHTALAAE
jgi:hypothetical protein